MKEQDFIKAVLSGRPLVLVEYRSTETDVINRKVVKTGQSAVMPIIKHKVLVGDNSYELPEFPEEGADLTKYVSPYVQRDTLVVNVLTMEQTKWGSRMSGDILGKLTK